MGRSTPRAVFGINGFVPYSRTTGLPYGEIRVLDSSNLTLSSELIELRGGSSKFAWAAEEGEITADLTLNIKETPDFVFELFLGNAPTPIAADATGDVSTLTNKNGSTIQSGTNGISTVGILSGSGANLKFGKYVVKGVAAGAFNLYYLTGIDLARGTDGTHIDDSLMVASSVTFTASVATVPAFGLTFAELGTSNFTVGDTATFEVLPIHGSATTVKIGGLATSSFPEFGALIYAQKRGTSAMTEIDAYRCKAAGMPIPFEVGAFQGYEVNAKLLYDDANDALFRWRHVEPT